MKSTLAAAVAAAACVDGGAAFVTPAVPSSTSSASRVTQLANAAPVTAPANLEIQSSATSTVPIVAAVAAFVGLAKNQKRQTKVALRATTRAQWLKRVKRIEGGCATFEVTIPKPLALVPRDFPNRPGVGVAQIKPDGNTDKYNQDCILHGKDGMFVLEGDEVVSVNGVDCQGKGLAVVGGLVKGAEGDSITIGLLRNYQVGPVKVVWEPGPKLITMKRNVLLRIGAETAGADVVYGCRDGFCSSCWHAEEGTNLIHRICKLTIPNSWDNVTPLYLLRSDEFKDRTGMSVTNMLQVDGLIPPAPVGVNAKELRKSMTKDREGLKDGTGGKLTTLFTIKDEDSGWNKDDGGGGWA